MEDLTRLVADSLARHGFTAAIDHRRLQWSRWFRCESSFSLLLVPSAAGLYALGEEILAPGELPSAGAKRILAVFQIAEAEDLCLALSRLFAPKNPLSARLAEGRCFLRFTLVSDPAERRSACDSLNRWLSSSSESLGSREAAAVTNATTKNLCENDAIGEGISTIARHFSGREKIGIEDRPVGTADPNLDRPYPAEARIIDELRTKNAS